MLSIKRRTFVLGLLASASLPVSARISFAARGPATDKFFVLVILRGAADGLAVIPPIGDPDYDKARNGLAFTRDQVSMLDQHFALHPALSDLKPWYDAKELIVFHAVATQYRERSHFDAQAILENGLDDPKHVSDGWLGRTLASVDWRERALAIGGGIPTVLAGGDKVMTWSPGRTSVPEQDLIERLAVMYDHDLKRSGFGSEIRASAGLIEGATKGMRGMPTNVDLAFSTAAGMMSAENGPNVTVISTNGWDTHNGQGMETGRLANAVSALNGGLLALRKGLGEERWRRTCVLVVSEFGRTVAQNGTAGTDHGTAGIALLAGGNVAGGRVIADWPGLSRKALYQGRDLAPTLDTRAVIKGVLADHLGISRRVLDKASFPDTSEMKPVPDLVKA